MSMSETKHPLRIDFGKVDWRFKHPFGTSPEGLLCEKLDKLLQDGQIKPLAQWMEDHHDALNEALSHAPNLALLMGAAFATTRQNDLANDFLKYSMDDQNKHVWQNFSDGSAFVQRQARRMNIVRMLKTLHPNFGIKLDLWKKALLDGQDPFVMKDIEQISKGKPSQQSAYQTALYASNIFPEDVIVAQMAINLAPDDQRLEALRYFARKHPDDDIIARRLDQLKQKAYTPK